MYNLFMTEQKIQIKNGSGETLIGVETLPRGEGKFPAVVLVHGFAYYKEEDGMFVDMAKHLAETGVASYRFDFSGCGESEGDFIDSSLIKLRDDLKSILKFVKARTIVDANRIGIVGQSFGTTVAIALAPKIKSLVLMGTVLNAREILINLFGDGYKPEGISARKRSDGSTTVIKPQFWKDFENHNLALLLRSMRYPILFIHGSKDDTVPLSEMEEAYETANEPKEKAVIEGADHGLEPKREKVYKIITDWFEKTL